MCLFVIGHLSRACFSLVRVNLSNLADDAGNGTVTDGHVVDEVESHVTENVPGIVHLSEEANTILCFVIIFVFAIVAGSVWTYLVVNRRKRDPEYRAKLAQKLIISFQVNKYFVHSALYVRIHRVHHHKPFI